MGFVGKMEIARKKSELVGRKRGSFAWKTVENVRKKRYKSA
jgi:hypothetical protein